MNQNQPVDLSKMTAEELAALLADTNATIALTNAQIEKTRTSAVMQEQKLAKQAVALTANIVSIQAAIDALPE